MSSAVSYRATVTFSGPSLDIVPGQTRMSDAAEVSFGTWMKGDTGAPGATGATGATGPAGADGHDGHTPVIAATKSGKKTTVTSDGTAVAEIMDGNDGADGAPGPNQVNAATDSDIAGLLKGAAGKVARAVPGTDYVAPESGKGLSSNDYTSAEKAKLASLHDYDDTALAGRVSAIEGKEAGWDGKYSKPSSGIPSSDMSSEVRTSLGKADTALQSHQPLDAFEKSLIAGGGITLSAPDPQTGRRTISAEEQDMETVVIAVECEDVSVSTAGVAVTKTEDSQTTTYTSDAQGQVSFRVKRGHQFTLSFGTLGAYLPPATTTYTASMPQRNITALYRGLSAICWGVRIKQSVSVPAQALVGDRSLWTAWQDKIGRYLLRNDGTARKLKADDSTKYVDGTAVDETEGHVMVRIPEFYYRVIDNGDGTCTLWGSEADFGGAYHVGEQWIGAYLGAAISGALVSRSGINPTRNWTIDAFHLLAKANGNDFGLTCYLHRQIMLMLFMWKYRSTNSQDPALLGYGMTGSGSNWTAAVQNELTGRTAALGDACGGVAFNTTGTLASHVSLYGIEDPFGWFWDMIQGVYFGSSANAPAQDGTEIFIYEGNRMPSAAELVSEPEGNFRKLTRLTTSGYPKILSLVDRFDLFATQYGGGSASNWYDYCYASATGQLLLFGGLAYAGSSCGLVYANSYDVWSVSSSALGARLAFYGNVTVED